MSSNESGQTSDAKPNSTEDKNWYVECSDDECYKKGAYVNKVKRRGVKFQ